MPRAKPAPAPGGALCWCGREARHRGWHRGQSQKLKSDTAARAPKIPRATKRSKLAGAVEAQLATCHASIARLKSEIKDRESELRRVERELAALVALHDVYRNLALPAPAVTLEPPAVILEPPAVTPSAPSVTSPASKVTASPALRPVSPPPAIHPGAPVEADIPTIHAWAAQRGLHCHSGDDLPAINRKREQLGLPTFKLLLGRRVGRAA